MKNMYDPMTGELLQPSEAEADWEPEMRFDPMTGEPLEQTGFDPMTGEPVYETAAASKKGKSKKIVIAAVIAGIAVIAGTITAVASGGAFLSKPDKVLLAAKRTLSDQPQFMEDLGLDKALSMIRSDRYKLEMKMDLEGESVEAAYISTKSEKQMNADVGISGLPSVEIISSLTDSQLKLYVPKLSSDVYVLNYKDDDAEGDLVDMLESGGISFEDLSDALSRLYAPDRQKKDAKELVKILHQQFCGLEWEKGESRQFKINGKSCKAAGYRVTVTSDDAEDFVQAMEDYIDNTFRNVGELNEYIDVCYGVAREMPDINCEFYIYKNRLAAVYMDMDDLFEAQLLFKGGDFRMQNMELEIDDGYDVMRAELTGKTTDSGESYELSTRWRTLLEMEYDKKSGEYEIVLDDEGDEAVIEGSILQERNQVGASAEIAGEGFGIEFSLTKDAKPESLPKDEVDLLDMDEEDIESLFDSF